LITSAAIIAPAAACVDACIVGLVRLRAFS